MHQYTRRSSSLARKTKALSNLVIVEQCVSHRRMDEGARKDRQHYSDRFLDVGGMKLYFVVI